MTRDGTPIQSSTVGPQKYSLVICAGDRKVTEYRRTMNQMKPFHRNTKLYKLRKLGRRPMNI